MKRLIELRAYGHSLVDIVKILEAKGFSYQKNGRAYSKFLMMRASQKTQGRETCSTGRREWARCSIESGAAIHR
jgi:hypothetical protein